MKKLEWQATRNNASTFKLQQGSPVPQMVVVYRRKQRGHSWTPWRAVSYKEAQRILEQPHDHELKIGDPNEL